LVSGAAAGFVAAAFEFKVMLEVAFAILKHLQNIDEISLESSSSRRLYVYNDKSSENHRVPASIFEVRERPVMFNAGRLAKAMLALYVSEIDIWPDNRAVSPLRPAEAHVQTPSKHRPTGLQVAPSHGFEPKHSYAS
jgi:hypothetical protein